MNSFKRYKILLLAIFLGGLSAIHFSHAGSESASEAAWTTDFEAAKSEAKAADKLLLVDFTGSDWCVWCIKLEKEVFSKSAFQSFAKDNFVLVEIDFPSSKIKQSAELKAQNKALAKKYEIEGYPTILILDADGAVVERTGYRPGGPNRYVKHLQEILSKAQAKG